MPRISRSVPHQVTRVFSAWKQFRPTKTYSGFTLEKFQEAMQLCEAVREDLRKIELQWDAALARREHVDASAKRMKRRVVLAVRADPDDGENSEIYVAMGFVPRNQMGRLVSRGKKRANKARKAGAARK